MFIFGAFSSFVHVLAVVLGMVVGFVKTQVLLLQAHFTTIYKHVWAVCYNDEQE